MTIRDVDAFLAEADDVIADWEGSADSATWNSDGSHQLDTGGEYYGADEARRQHGTPDGWVRRIMDEVVARAAHSIRDEARRMRPITIPPHGSYQRDTPPRASGTIAAFDPANPAVPTVAELEAAVASAGALDIAFRYDPAPPPPPLTMTLRAGRVYCDRCGVDVGSCQTSPDPDSTGWLVLWDANEVDTDHVCSQEAGRG